MQAIGYARISTADQSTNSIPGQIDRITSYCKRNGLTLVQIFTDDGQSAANFDRRQWHDVEAIIKKNRDIKYLIVDAMDRFSRADIADALVKMNEIQRRTGVTILTTSDPVTLDIDDLGTDIRRIMELVMANYELKRIRKRTSQGIYQAMASGKWVSNAPYGYINARDTTGRPTLKIDDEKAYAVRLIFRKYISGEQLDDIRKHVASAGFTLKGNSAIRRILENPVYAGLISLPANGHEPPRMTKGLHAGIITEGDYWIVQDMLKRKARGLQSREGVYLKGGLRCHCGLILSSDKVKGKAKHYSYYLCRMHRKNLSAIKLNKQMDEILDLLSFSEETAKTISEGLRAMIDEKAGNKGGDLMRANMALQKVQQKILEADEKYLTTETVSERAYKKVIAGLKADEARLLQQIAELSSDTRDYYTVLDRIIDKLTNVKGSFHALPVNKRPQFLQVVFGPCLWYEDGTFRTPYIHPMFAYNELILKEKGLLEIQQPSFNLGVTPVSSPYGIRTRITTVKGWCPSP